MKNPKHIVICVGDTPSMTNKWNRIGNMVVWIFTVLVDMDADVRIALVKYRSAHDVPRTRVHGFTDDINIIQQWFNGDEPGGMCEDGCELVGTALNDALNIGWLENTDNKKVNEKLVFLITDGAPAGLFTQLEGADPWMMSNEFKKQNITLFVVGVGRSIVACDDFYCALAENTGGRYIPMVNFQRIFEFVMEKAFSGNDTFCRVIRHVAIEEFEMNSKFKYSYMKDRVNDMINECETMKDIQKFFFNGLSRHI